MDRLDDLQIGSCITLSANLSSRADQDIMNERIQYSKPLRFIEGPAYAGASGLARFLCSTKADRESEHGEKRNSCHESRQDARPRGTPEGVPQALAAQAGRTITGKELA
jgi:hypothetical protein